jgi:hypothetical protein
MKIERNIKFTTAANLYVANDHIPYEASLLVF